MNEACMHGRNERRDTTATLLHETINIQKKIKKNRKLGHSCYGKSLQRWMFFTCHGGDGSCLHAYAYIYILLEHDLSINSTLKMQSKHF